MEQGQILITKANGEQEPFDRRKLERSLRRSGAPRDVRDAVADEVERQLREGMHTQEIYKLAFELLRTERKKPLAARYSIKRAILELGPSGFPFERFVGEVLKAIGYHDVRNDIVVQGKCVEHEVDILAKNGETQMGAEVKFHNSPGLKTDLKAALYVRERFDDLSGSVDEGWLITNTRFTYNAIRYGKCSGLRMLGWNYPHGRGLEVLIEEAGVHPITALTSISNETRRQLLDDGIVLCRQMIAHLDNLHTYGVSQSEIETVTNEVIGLCQGVSPEEENGV